MEFEALAEEGRRERQQLQLRKERISLFRRDAAKLIALGLEQDAGGPWEALRQRYMGLLTPLRRLREVDDLTTLEASLAALREEAAKALENLVIAAKIPAMTAVMTGTNLIQKQIPLQTLNLLSNRQGLGRRDP